MQHALVLIGCASSVVLLFCFAISRCRGACSYRSSGLGLDFKHASHLKTPSIPQYLLLGVGPQMRDGVRFLTLAVHRFRTSPEIRYACSSSKARRCFGPWLSIDTVRSSRCCPSWSYSSPRYLTLAARL